jgi:hypothetical protein
MAEASDLAPSMLSEFQRYGVWCVCCVMMIYFAGKWLIRRLNVFEAAERARLAALEAREDERIKILENKIRAMDTEIKQLRSSSDKLVSYCAAMESFRQTLLHLAESGQPIPSATILHLNRPIVDLREELDL